MTNIRIGLRLGAAFGLILALLVTIALTGLTRIQSLGDTAETLAGSRYQKAAAAASLRYFATDMSRQARSILLADEPATKAGYRKNYDEMRDKTVAAIDHIDGLLRTKRGRELIEQVRTASTQYLTFADDVVALGMQGKREEGAQLLFGPRNAGLASFMKAVNDMVAYQELQMQKAGAAATKERDGAVILLASLSTAAALAAAVLAWLITRSITRPLNVVLDAAQRIAGGDLSAEVPLRGRDETGRLLRAVSDMQDSLVKTVSAVRRNAESVAAASLQIAQGNSELSQRTEEQASALEQTAATMSELGVTVRNNADNARQAAQLAVNVRDTARQGKAMRLRQISPGQ